LSRKHKITILTVVVLAVLAIFLISDLAVFAPGEDGKAVPADEQFETTDDPYTAYNEALEQDQPVVIEFYARW